MSALEWVAAFTLFPVGMGVTVWGIYKMVGMGEIAPILGKMAFAASFLLAVLMALNEGFA